MSRKKPKWGDLDYTYRIEEMTLTELQTEMEELVAQFEQKDPHTQRLARVVARLLELQRRG
jgi:hypothetical protein